MPQPRTHGPQRQTSRTTLIAIAVAGVLILCGGAVGIATALGDDPAEPAAQPPATSAPPGSAAAPQAIPTIIKSVVPSTPVPPTTPMPTTSAAPKTLAVPNLVGNNAAVADDELRKLGFTNVNFGSQDKNDRVVLLLTNWTVTKQSTKAGQKVPADTLIVLTCTKE